MSGATAFRVAGWYAYVWSAISSAGYEKFSRENALQIIEREFG